MVVVDCACRWLSAVFMYIVWLSFQLKRLPGELKIWVLKDCTCNEKMATSRNGELIWLVCLLSSYFICAIARQVLALVFIRQ